MKPFLARLILILVFGIALQCQSQTDDFAKVLQHIEASLRSYNAKNSLIAIDNELIKEKQPEENTVILKTLKVEALVKADLFNQALELSNSIIYSRYLTGDYKIRLLLQRALLYEILDKFGQSRKELDAVAALYKDPRTIRNEHYGQYLYRESSFYRVQGEDYLALDYALRSKSFGDAHHYEDVSAVSSMLLAFLSKDRQKVRYFLNEALNIWKSFGDSHGISAMHIAHAQNYLKDKDYTLALKHSDTALIYARKTSDFGQSANAYMTKSQSFERLKQMDSALSYYKAHVAMSNEQLVFQEKLKVSQLEFGFELQKMKIKRDVVFKDNQQIKAYNKRLIFSIIGLGLFLGVILFLLYKISGSNKKIQSQNEHIEAVNHDLSNLVKEKELLFKELHHRVKNNLALILGLVEFHSNEIEDPTYVDKFNALKNRISSIAIVHKEFLASDHSDINQKRNIAEYANKIADSLILLHSEKINYYSNIQNTELPIDLAIPIGMLLNELISNTIKHAKVEKTIDINLEISKSAEVLAISYRDNGISFAPQKDHNSLGIFIIESMISQLNGQYIREGSHYQISLNIQY